MSSNKRWVSLCSTHPTGPLLNGRTVERGRGCAITLATLNLPQSHGIVGAIWFEGNLDRRMRARVMTNSLRFPARPSKIPCWSAENSLLGGNNIKRFQLDRANFHKISLLAGNPAGEARPTLRR